MQLLGITFAPSAAGGTVSPAGITGSIQYNSSSVLDGDAYLIWDKPNQHLKLKPTVAPNNSALTIQNAAGNIVTTFTYDGRFGVNQHPDNTALAGAGFALTTTQQYYPQIFLENKHTSQQGGYIFFAKQNGVGGSITSDQHIGTFTFRGWGTTDYRPLAGLSFRTGMPVDVGTSIPTFFKIDLCNYGAIISSEAFRISPDKCVGINNLNPVACIDAIAKDTTSSNHALILKDSLSVPLFTIRNDGAFTFRGGTVSLAQTGWSGTTTVLRNLSAGSQLTDVINALSTLIADLKTKGILGV